MANFWACLYRSSSKNGRTQFSLTHYNTFAFSIFLSVLRFKKCKYLILANMAEPIPSIQQRIIHSSVYTNRINIRATHVLCQIIAVSLCAARYFTKDFACVFIWTTKIQSLHTIDDSNWMPLCSCSKYHLMWLWFFACKTV